MSARGPKPGREKEALEMEIADRGSKHACTDCGITYYDLKKEVVACPKCGAKPVPTKATRASRKKAKPAETGAFKRYL